jgi:hypothetical protein
MSTGAITPSEAGILYDAGFTHTMMRWLVARFLDRSLVLR